MGDLDRTKAELVAELEALRLRVAEVESAASARAEGESLLTSDRYLLDSLMHNTPDAIYFKDRESRFVRVSRAVVDSFGRRDPAEVVGKTDFDFFTVEHAEQAFADEQEVMRTGQPLIGRVEKETWPGGRVTWASTTKLPLKDAEGRIIGTFGISRNITERKRAEEQVLAERDKAQRYLDIAGVILVVIDRDQKVTLINRMGCEILGYEEAAIVGRNWFDCFVPERLRKQVKGAFVELMRGNIESVEYYENPVLTRSGEERLIVWRNNVFHDAEGRIISTLSSGLDITESRRAEAQQRRLAAQMQEAQKLESLGVLAGGIAHDFNNILTTILGNADLALHQVPEGVRARETIEEIATAARRAAGLANEMLAYSGRGKFITEPTDLTALVDETARLVAASVSKKATLDYRLAADLPLIECDTTQIRQTVMNLILNASEALGDEGGAITVTTGSMECDRAYLDSSSIASRVGRDEPLPEGPYVYLEVADTGCGMDGRTKKRIFEPFFSTKRTGRGLGMAAVLGIVRGHHAAIRVDSTRGEGTTFRVLFPVRDGVEAPEAQAEREEAAVRQADPSPGRVLFVDDDEAIRRMAAAMLRKAGFDVLTAEDGQDALDVLDAHAGEVACMVLDLTMPRLDGEGVIARLRERGSRVPIILSSGYSEDEITRRFADDGLAGFVQKPYPMETLIDKVRQAIEE